MSEDLDLLRAKARQANSYMNTALRLESALNGVVVERDALMAEVARLRELARRARKVLADMELGGTWEAETR